MKSNERNTERIYYTIGEVSRMFDVNTSLIRFWEKEFDVIKPHKNKKGNRLFTQKDVDNFHMIYHLVKERGYTLKGANEKIKRHADDIRRDVEILKTLNKMRDFLMALKSKL